MSNLILSAYLAKQGWPRVTDNGRQKHVDRLEARYGIVLPDDFREYILTLCPADDELDDDLGTWWGLNGICNLPEGYNSSIRLKDISVRSNQYLLFADHSFWCWAWAISCTDDDNRGKVALISGAPDKFVAASFSEFAERYVADWASVC